MICARFTFTLSVSLFFYGRACNLEVLETRVVRFRRLIRLVLLVSYLLSDNTTYAHSSANGSTYLRMFVAQYKVHMVSQIKARYCNKSENRHDRCHETHDRSLCPEFSDVVRVTRGKETRRRPLTHSRNAQTQRHGWTEAPEEGAG